MTRNAVLLVCGSRQYDDAERVDQVLCELREKFAVRCIVEDGWPGGAAMLAGQWADINRVQHRRWRHPKRPFKAMDYFIRNAAILSLCHAQAVVHFAGDAYSQDMVTKARVAGLPVLEITP